MVDVSWEPVGTSCDVDVVGSGRTCQQLPTAGADSLALTTNREGISQAVCQHAASSVAAQHLIDVCVAHSGAMVEAYGDGGAVSLSSDVRVVADVDLTRDAMNSNEARLRSCMVDRIVLVRRGMSCP